MCSLPITSSGCNLYSKRLKYLSLYPKSTYSLHVRKNANSSESLLPTVWIVENNQLNVYGYVQSNYETTAAAEGRHNTICKYRITGQRTSIIHEQSIDSSC